MSKFLGQEQIKENALSRFWQMIRISWTFERLTEQEQERLHKVIFSTQTENAVKGTFEQRWAILHAIYTSFLMALDYQPIGWRENAENMPKF